MCECPVNLPAPFDIEDDSVLINAAGSIVRTLRAAGYEAYFAGGFVRDKLIGRIVHDVDIATSALPDQVQLLFPESRAFGKSFGVIQVEINETTCEVATFRRDMQYRDGRRPESVQFTTAAEDAQRRDFTVNGLFYDPVNHVVIDYVCGLQDIQKKQIRAIGDPAKRFQEDHLRLLRAVRFASVLEFSIEEETLDTIKAAAETLNQISAERIRIELERMFMESPKPEVALDLLRDTGILRVILPEVQKLIGVEQPPEFHPEGDVYVHTRLMLENMRNRSPELIWAILLHDIAKPETFQMGTDRDGKPRIQFRGHAELGAVMSEQIMRRFRCSNEQISAVKTAIRNHMKFISVPEMRKSTLRRWVGSEHFALELELHRVDCLSSHGKLDHYDYLIEYQEALSKEPVLPSPLLSGDDLIAQGLKPGRKLGKVLKALYDAQLEGKFTTRDDALHWLDKNSGDDLN